MKDLTHWLALALAPGVGSILFKRLLEAFGSPREALRASFRELKQVDGIGPKVAAGIRRFDWEPRVEKELREAERAGVHLITWEDGAYPLLLKEIYDPPPLLYVSGSVLAQDGLAVAVVGSRNPTSYGQAAAERLARDLGRRGATVVSGLARGIDSCAHRGALSGGGRTIGVLGCGIDVVYPPENEELYAQVAAQGAVISEFPLGTPPESDHFPIRNRVISGLSRGVAVVEATLHSGSLITAHLALDQGREVYAVPGNVDSARSQGTNRLIKEGARLVSGADDILEDLRPSTREPLVQPPPPCLSEEENRVLSALSWEAVHIDQVIAKSGLPSPRVSALLLSLELNGHVRQFPGKRFARM
ncbi:MAG: DNA-protecting protein DprA [Deltaproteobacteria bacterium]|nr:DNA-protecting protein DprA [Deltaproteobacteria bacterium]